MRLTRRFLSRDRLLLLSLPAAALLLAGIVALTSSGGADRPIGRTSIAAEFRGAHAVLHRVGNHAELTISDMPQSPVGEVYEVWLSGAGGQPKPTDALFTVTKDGKGAVEVPGSLRGIQEVMVTSEPVGGSSHPTSPADLTVLLDHDSEG